MNRPLIVIAGPTASGKTGVSLGLAAELSIEIVGADSVQLYRGLDIGSGKVSVSERGATPHHMIDLLEPDQQFTAGDYARLATSVIDEIWARRRVPVVCGGTGMYLRALLYGLDEMPTVEPAVRVMLLQRLADDGLETLYQELSGVDPVWAAKIASNDRQRIVRGLEIFHATGAPLSSFQTQRDREPRLAHLMLKLDVPADVLRRRIAHRVGQMFNGGFVAEVGELLRRGYTSEHKAMQSIGYRQICQHIDGDLSLVEAQQLIIRGHQRYAKRQRTWFRKMPGVSVPPDLAQIVKLVGDYLG